MIVVTAGCSPGISLVHVTGKRMANTGPVSQ